MKRRPALVTEECVFQQPVEKTGRQVFGLPVARDGFGLDVTGKQLGLSSKLLRNSGSRWADPYLSRSLEKDPNRP